MLFCLLKFQYEYGVLYNNAWKIDMAAAVKGMAKPVTKTDQKIIH
jgi:hypothetical protein